MNPMTQFHSIPGRVNVGRICFANVLPVFHGLDNGLKPDWLRLVNRPPAELNRLMRLGELDISPVSSAAFAENDADWFLLPDISISCIGPVKSVLLVSRYPFDRLDQKKMVLTDHSDTAVLLLKLLFSLKKVHPRFETRAIRSMDDLGAEDHGALVIGDTALKERWNTRYDHVLDLGEMWHRLTGLPFVFAVWAVRKAFALESPRRVAQVLNLIRISRQTGLRSMERIIASTCEKLGLNKISCKHYYDSLFFDLDSRKLKGLAAFWDYLYQEKLIRKKVTPDFFCEN